MAQNHMWLWYLIEKQHFTHPLIHSSGNVSASLRHRNTDASACRGYFTAAAVLMMPNKSIGTHLKKNSRDEQTLPL